MQWINYHESKFHRKVAITTVYYCTKGQLIQDKRRFSPIFSFIWKTFAYYVQKWVIAVENVLQAKRAFIAYFSRVLKTWTRYIRSHLAKWTNRAKKIGCWLSFLLFFSCKKYQRTNPSSFLVWPCQPEWHCWQSKQ